MKDLFRLHNVENDLGLVLLHKHSMLHDGERLTDVRGTSNPLTFKIGQPSIWKISPDLKQLIPVEFSMENGDIDWQKPSMQRFLAAFACLLAEYDAEYIFGLCRYPGDGYPGRTEFTVGRSNVNLTPKEVSYYISF